MLFITMVTKLKPYHKKRLTGGLGVQEVTCNLTISGLGINTNDMDATVSSIIENAIKANNLSTKTADYINHNLVRIPITQIIK